MTGMLLADARLAPDLEHLAHRRAAVGDPRVQGADAQLEAPGFELLELGHDGVEAPPLLVHENDVTGADALGGGALGSGFLHRRDARARPGRHPRAGRAARGWPRGRCAPPGSWWRRR